MFFLSQRGQGLVEYGMLIVLVAIVVLLLLMVLGSSVGNLFSNIIANV